MRWARKPPKNRYQWHKWFAWRPVHAHDRHGGYVWVWLERVNRRRFAEWAHEWEEYYIL